MKLLIVNNYDSFTYNLVQIVDQSGMAEWTLRKIDEIEIDEVNIYDKILLSPGPGLPNDFPNLKKLIEQAHVSVGILGVCLGHQAIAEVFGARLVKLKNINHGYIGNIQLLNSNDYLFEGIPEHFDGGLYNSWIVSEKNLPESLLITARSKEGIIMAISHKHHDIKGIQFHPESVMTPSGERILLNWLNH